MKYAVSILISLVVTGGFVNAQHFKTELAYSFIIDKSQNVANINIVNYTKNERIELRFLSRYGYSHFGIEAISFSENAIRVRNGSPFDNISYVNNPGNFYDLTFINVGLGLNLSPLHWLRFNSGFTFGFLVQSDVHFNNSLNSDGYIAKPMNNLMDKEDAINAPRINVFQAVNIEYSLMKKVTFSLGYKFEVPILPLVTNDSASGYFTLANEDKENYLQFITLGIGYNF